MLETDCVSRDEAVSCEHSSAVCQCTFTTSSYTFTTCMDDVRIQFTGISHVNDVQTVPDTESTMKDYHLLHALLLVKVKTNILLTV